MEKEVDVISFCKKIEELTLQERCDWKETSEKSRYKLKMKTGSVEIFHYEPNQFDLINLPRYEISFYDSGQYRFASYESTNRDSEEYKVFSRLYSTVVNFLEKMKKRKIALLLDEIESSEK